MVDLAGFSVPYRQGVGCCLSDIKYIIDNVKFSGVPSTETGGGEVGERREITIDIRDVDLTKSSMSSVFRGVLGSWVKVNILVFSQRNLVFLWIS